jgi:hypothetical protein
MLAWGGKRECHAPGEAPAGKRDAGGAAVFQFEPGLEHIGPGRVVHDFREEDALAEGVMFDEKSAENGDYQAPEGSKR